MGLNCINCEKKIGYIESYRKLISEKEDVFCMKCYDKIAYIKESIEKSYRNVDYNKEYESLLTDMNFSDGAKCSFEEFCINHNENLCNTTEEEFEIDLENELLERIFITTGYNFQGYDITKYLGVLSGDVVIGTGMLTEISASLSDFLGLNSEKFAMKMEEGKNIATKKLLKKALTLGADGVIGIDFDYITFSNNMIGVSVNGTAVNFSKKDI